MNYEISFIKALIITILIECTILFILSYTLFKKQQLKSTSILLTGFFASFATLPYFWFILPIFIQNKIQYTISSEILAVVIETFLIHGFLKTTLKQSFIISLICNSISFGIGLLIQHCL